MDMFLLQGCNEMEQEGLAHFPPEDYIVVVACLRSYCEGFLGTECDRAQHCGPLRLRLDYGYSPTASGDVSTPQLV